MKQYPVIKRALSASLLVAALILPSGASKTVMANGCLKTNVGQVVCDTEAAGKIDDENPVSIIRFFNRI
ncbi:MAG: hypothetical protein WKI04_11635 [Ferruginibacter sp.]